MSYGQAGLVPQQVERALIGRFGDRHILLTTASPFVPREGCPHGARSR
ncbi:hypothetical protein [Streptomyces sp. NPDC126499]